MMILRSTAASPYVRKVRIAVSVLGLVDQIDVRKITRGDFQVLSYLKSQEPALYRRLRQQATERPAHKRPRHRAS